MESEALIKINEACKEKNFNKILALCKEYSQNYLGLFIVNALEKQRQGMNVENNGLLQYVKYFNEKINYKVIKVKLLCDWTEGNKLADLWSKMKPLNSNIELVNDNNVDYWVIINRPLTSDYYNPMKTIVFQMEPNMNIDKLRWGEWSNPKNFLKVFSHKEDYNNIEWHISMNAKSPIFDIKKDYDNTISAIISNKYHDPGHIIRCNFLKYAEDYLDIDVYGSTDLKFYSYKGTLPYHEKDNGLYPYKYHFAAENNKIKNYFTEKIIDPILSECLCFYWGCPNISDYIDPNAYIVLSLEDFDHDIKVIEDAILHDEWSKRIDTIKREKKKIMENLNFFTRIESAISNL